MVSVAPRLRDVLCLPHIKATVGTRAFAFSLQLELDVGGPWQIMGARALSISLEEETKNDGSKTSRITYLKQGNHCMCANLTTDRFLLCNLEPLFASNSVVLK